MTNARPFRFGVADGDGVPSREAWETLVRHAEDLGYATFLVADHYVNEFPPISSLMAAADAASTIRIGSFVFDNDFRHPAQLAKEVATLDLLSGGRFELGIGAGWHRPDYEQVGLLFDPARVRIDRLAEAVIILKQFFTQETVTFAGTHYTVSNLQAFPKPVQRPYPPLFIGGGGQRVLTLAGREADIVGFLPRAQDNGTVDPSELTEAALAQKVAWVREASGERFAKIELSQLMSAVILTSDRQQAASLRAQSLGLPAVTAEHVLSNPYLLIGTHEHIAEQLQRLRELYGISYFVVTVDDMEALAPVVARLAGT
jgi:probable F420-dependent oxidoreductase